MIVRYVDDRMRSRIISEIMCNMGCDLGRVVDAGEAALVLQNAHPQRGRAGEQPVEESRLARTEEPGDQGDGQGAGH